MSQTREPGAAPARLDQRALQLTVALSGVALAYATPSAPLRAFAVVASLTALVVGPRVELGRVGQALGSLVAMTAGVLLARAAAPDVDVPGMLTQRALLLGLPMVLVAAFRAVLVEPAYGAKLTLVAALVGLTAAGRSRTGMVFPTLAVASVVAGLVALRAHDPNRAPLRVLTLRSWLGAVFGLALAVGLLAGARVGLPRLQASIAARMMARYQPRTGFSESMFLGAMSGLLESDKVVMRVRGGRPGHLRGFVFLRYSGGRWDPGRDAQRYELVETPDLPPDATGLVELEHAGKPERYFTPLGARDLYASSGFYDRDPFALVRASQGAAAKRLWFREADGSTEPPPGPLHLEVPRSLGVELRKLLGGWGVGNQPPAERLALIDRHLQAEYAYSLSFDRASRKDPVYDFLFVHKEGHCEYFASAFVLLARMAGVPTHLVGGYRYGETSPLGYGIVRERNAHAWAESWVDGRWVTYDSTPAGDLAASAPSETALLSAAWDGLRTGWEVVDDWLSRRTAFEFSLALVLMVGGLFLVRALRAREPQKAAQVVDAIPAEIGALFEALARRGLEIAASDTLGRIAERTRGLEDVDASLLTRMDGVLRDYERLRYAGVGDEAEVLGRLREATLALRGRQ